jgi:two-component system, OmpR family, phosphate regulon sensor histidine kinase PhoR
MESYEELRSAFTAAVSHELRTPLARLLALLESAELPGADRDGLLVDARGEVERMTALVDEILFLSELESGREVVTLTPARAAPVLRDVADDLRERSERAGVALSVEVDEELELPLRPRMLRVVVQNLAENALRYAGEGATCVLSARREEEERVLAAKDDGAGVPGRDLPRLFERFYRGDRARTSRGTGLGLSIVKHVVESAGGRVEARANDGTGLEIRCSFPG